MQKTKFKILKNEKNVTVLVQKYICNKTKFLKELQRKKN